MSESSNPQDLDDLSSDMGDSADDGDASDSPTHVPPAGATIKGGAPGGPDRGVTVGHDGVHGDTTGNG